MSLYGFFAHMEWDTEEGRATLRLLLDCEEGLYPYPVRLDADALDVAVSRATKAARMQSMGGGRFSGTSPGNASASMAESLEPLVSLVRIYLKFRGKAKIKSVRPALFEQLNLPKTVV